MSLNWPAGIREALTRLTKDFTEEFGAGGPERKTELRAVAGHHYRCVHLSEDNESREHWHRAGFAVLPPRDGHPLGAECVICSGYSGIEDRSESMNWPLTDGPEQDPPLSEVLGDG